MVWSTEQYTTLKNGAGDTSISQNHKIIQCLWAKWNEKLQKNLEVQPLHKR